MFSAAELIDILLVRMRRRWPLHTERAFGEFPPTWRVWFLSIHERVGAVTGVPVEAIIEECLKRPLTPPPRAPAPLGRLGGFRRLWRQQWEAAPRDQRGIRRIAAVMSAFLHLVFAVLLFIVAMVQIGDAPPDTAQAGEAIQVEFIGQGVPEEQEGGAPAQGERLAEASAAQGTPGAASASESSAASAAASAATASASESAVSDVQPTQAAVEQAAAPLVEPQPLDPPEPSPTPATQPLTVSAVDEPNTDFVVPPTAARTAPTSPPKIESRDPDARIVEIDTVEPGEVRTMRRPDRPQPVLRSTSPRDAVVEIDTIDSLPPAPERRLAPRTNTPKPLQSRDPRASTAEIETMDVPTDVPALRPAPGVARTPQLRSSDPRAAPGEIALREPARTSGPGAASSPNAAARPGTTTATNPSPQPGAAAQSRGTTAATTPGSPAGRPQTQGSGRTTGAAPAGSGPTRSPQSGAPPGTLRGDDWGDSTRNRPGNATAGNAPGVFGNDGRVRLPDGDGGRVGGGLPPGTITEDFEKIDRMGTWLKRPPLDYTPTRFDRFWVPHRNLLEEWVQRGIKEVLIPIPGTNKKMRCVVSLLQAAGGCTITDPNLQDQEAEARPPPAVPFKRELQENQDDLKR